MKEEISNKVIGWKLWYDDGNVFSSHDGQWKDAPQDGVLEMMVYYEKKDGMGRPTRLSLGGHDWYFSDGDQLFGCNTDSLKENKRRYPQCIFKRGKWTTAEKMDRVHQKAMSDYDI